MKLVLVPSEGVSARDTHMAKVMGAPPRPHVAAELRCLNRGLDPKSR